MYLGRKVLADFQQTIIIIKTHWRYDWYPFRQSYIRLCKVPRQPMDNQTNSTCMVIIPFLSCKYCFLIKQARNHLCRMMMRLITSLWRASWSICLSDSFKNTCAHRLIVNYGKLETDLNDKMQIVSTS